MSQCHDSYPPTGYQLGPAIGAEGAACHDPEPVNQTDPVDRDWCEELVLADTVRKWARAHFPGDETTETAAVAEAWHAFLGGASIPEAVSVAERRAASRHRHPSHA